MVNKIQLKKIDGSIIFEYEKENNTVIDTILAFRDEELEKGKEIVDLSYADLNHADLSKLAFHVDFCGINLSYANLNHANLSYTYLNGVNLSYADLSYANLKYAYLINAVLNYSTLKYANLECVYFNYADLNHADLQYTNISEASLKNICGIGINLYKADLSYTNLTDANLTDGDLRFVNLKNADLLNTKLYNTVLSNASFRCTHNIQYATCCFSGHGEAGRELLCVKINGVNKFFCGCFIGEEESLRSYIKKGKEYFKESRLIALETVLKLIDIDKNYKTAPN